MNTYRLAALTSGRWGIEWFVGGQSQGLAWGSYTDFLDGLDAIHELIMMETYEAAPKPPASLS
jgi:hypothetical protein